MSGRLKLRLLLTLTPFLLRRAAQRSARLRHMMRHERFVMQLATGDGVTGHFDLDGGRLSYRSGAHPSPDFVQRWRSAAEAIAVLTSRDETEMLRAAEDGRCRMQGAFRVAMWFNEAGKISRQSPFEPG